MTLTATQYALWLAGFVSHALVFAVMLRRGNYRRWPSLFSLAIFELTLAVVLYSLQHNYAAYFYTYWIAALMRALLGLWLILDIVKALPGIKYAPRSLELFFLSAAVVMALGSAWLARSGGENTFEITMMVFALNRCIAVVWGTFAVTLFGAVGFCGLGWTPTPLKMAGSFLVLVLASCADSYAMSLWPKFVYKIDDAFNLFSLAVWLVWSGIMNHRPSDALQRVIEFPQPHIERGSGI